MSTAAARLTYTDVWALPWDGRIKELIGGTLVRHPAKTRSHQLVLTNLLAPVWIAVKEREYGLVNFLQFNVVLSPHDLVLPDLMVVTKERYGIRQDDHYAGAPDLLAEVISEELREHDERVKRDLYARYGVREYWLVDPEAATFRLFVNVDGRFEEQVQRGRVASSVVLAGLAVDLDELFANLPR